MCTVCVVYVHCLCCFFEKSFKRSINRCVQYFLNWAEHNYGREWLSENVHAFLALGPPFLGAPKVPLVPEPCHKAEFCWHLINLLRFLSRRTYLLWNIFHSSLTELWSQALRTVLSGDCMGLEVFLELAEGRTFARMCGSTPWLLPMQEKNFPDVIVRINTKGLPRKVGTLSPNEVGTFLRSNVSLTSTLSLRLEVAFKSFVLLYIFCPWGTISTTRIRTIICSQLKYIWQGVEVGNSIWKEQDVESAMSTFVPRQYGFMQKYYDDNPLWNKRRYVGSLGWESPRIYRRLLSAGFVQHKYSVLSSAGSPMSCLQCCRLLPLTTCGQFMGLTYLPKSPTTIRCQWTKNKASTSLSTREQVYCSTVLCSST